jgi:hypothetical protein
MTAVVYDRAGVDEGVKGAVFFGSPPASADWAVAAVQTAVTTVI